MHLHEITFDKLPALVWELNKKIDVLMKQSNASIQPEKDFLMSIEQLIEFLPEHPARQTVYGWVNERVIPFEKHGKRLYFRKSVINEWLMNGRKN